MNINQAFFGGQPSILVEKRSIKVQHFIKEIKAQCTKAYNGHTQSQNNINFVDHKVCIKVLT